MYAKHRIMSAAASLLLCGAWIRRDTPVEVGTRPITATLTMSVGSPGFPPPECLSDWDRNGTHTSQDFFLFLDAFFGGTADFNCDRVVNTDDFFGFLAEFFAGC